MPRKKDGSLLEGEKSVLRLGYHRNALGDPGTFYGLELAGFSGLKSVTSIYGTLSGLVQVELIKGSGSENGPLGGKERKLYQIGEAGIARVQAEKLMPEELPSQWTLAIAAELYPVLRTCGECFGIKPTLDARRLIAVCDGPQGEDCGVVAMVENAQRLASGLILPTSPGQ